MPPDPSNLERARALFCAAHASVDSQSTIYVIASALDERERAGFKAGAEAAATAADVEEVPTVGGLPPELIAAVLAQDTVKVEQALIACVVATKRCIADRIRGLKVPHE